MPRELQNSQCLWPARTKNVTGHFIQAYTFLGLGTAATMSSDADLSFITTSVTTNKSKLYFRFSSCVPFKKVFQKFFSVFLPVDPLLHLVFQRQPVVILLGIYQCCHNSDNSLSQTVLQSRCKDKNGHGTPCAKPECTYTKLLTY